MASPAEPQNSQFASLRSSLLSSKMASCESRGKPLVPAYFTIKRANSEQLRQIFNKYASQSRKGERFMTLEDFVRGYLGLYNTEDFNEETVRLLGSVVS